MGAINLALLLIVAAIGMDGVQPMTTHQRTADQHYHEKDADVDIAWEPRVGCAHDWVYDLWFCWREGCNPDNPAHYCFQYMHCQDNRDICQEYKHFLEVLPCFGRCWAA